MNTTNKFGLSRYIPTETKNLVAQHCGYGCVFCGEIPYEFEHIDPPFSEALIHDPEKICLLCPVCHAKVTKNLIAKSQVISANANPWCRRMGFNKLGLWFSGQHMRIRAGSVLFDGPDVPIAICGHPIVSFRKSDGGNIIINAVFYSRDGVPIGKITNNEWNGFVESFSVLQVGNKIHARHAGLDILVLEIKPPNEINLIFVDMVFGGCRVAIYDHGGDLLLISPKAFITVDNRVITKYRCIDVHKEGITLYNIGENLPWE